ncbi:MAG: J domain-containing protein [Phycisphaerae bacterium]
MHHPKDPTRFECLAALGLTSGASWREIQRAYRRLAVRYHPDRNHGRSAPDSDRAKFHQVTRAYALLQCSARVMDRRSALGRCHRCRDMETLQQGLDGNRYCRSCRTHAGGKRILAGPPPVWVRLGPTLGGLMVSAGSLTVWLLTARPTFWWVAMVVCTASMVAMAGQCMTVPYAADPRSGGARTNRHSKLATRTQHWLWTVLNS